MSLIVLYFLHSTSVLSFCIDVILTLSILMVCNFSSMSHFRTQFNGNLSIGNPFVEIRRSYDHLISTIGFPILERLHLYIESGPWLLYVSYLLSKG